MSSRYLDVENVIRGQEGYNSNNLHVPPELKRNAQKLCWEYNQTGPFETEKRKEILQKLLGKCTDLTFIEPSFRCDYGFNIFIHGLAVINYNCVILDTSPVNLGENIFIAPGVCIACAGHSIDPTQRAEGISTSNPIVIKRDVWIGANAVICGSEALFTELPLFLRKNPVFKQDYFLLSFLIPECSKLQIPAEALESLYCV